MSQWVNTSDGDFRILLDKWVNTMATDTLAPWLVKSSESMTMQVYGSFLIYQQVVKNYWHYKCNYASWNKFRTSRVNVFQTADGSISQSFIL